MPDNEEPKAPAAPAKGKSVKKPSARPDMASLIGIALALTGILGGLILEKGQIGDIAQGTAALIVLGGTMGAVRHGQPDWHRAGADRHSRGAHSGEGPNWGYCAGNRRPDRTRRNHGRG